MATQVQQRISNGASRSTPNANQFPDPIVTNRPPNGFDRAEPAQGWLDTSGPAAYVCGGTDNTGATVWIVNSSGAINVPSMTLTGAGNALTITQGNVVLNGPGATLTLQAGSTTTLGTLLAVDTTVNDLTVGGDETIAGTLMVTGDATFN